MHSQRMTTLENDKSCLCEEGYNTSSCKLVMRSAGSFQPGWHTANAWKWEKNGCSSYKSWNAVCVDSLN